MRIRPPELETSICDAKYHVSLSTRSVLGKCVYLVTLVMSLFDLQDVRIAIGSLATLDLPMVVDLIGIYGLKGPYCTLTTTNWFLQALSVIPRGSWGDVSRRFYHDPLGRLETLNLVISGRRPSPQASPPPPSSAAATCRRKIVSGQLNEKNPSVQISSGLLVQADEGIPSPVMDLIDDIYHRLPRSAVFFTKPVGARHELPARIEMKKINIEPATAPPRMAAPHHPRRAHERARRLRAGRSWRATARPVQRMVADHVSPPVVPCCTASRLLIGRCAAHLGRRTRGDRPRWSRDAAATCASVAQRCAAGRAPLFMGRAARATRWVATIRI
ncbi:hypothetical protein F511_19743 [Dorcoceras hygrometricum]|uniref:Uncharacterized protein n=1 Tax=Dorcoceras hygrometricum TaxID=472368 RepID=A0A2Z7A628_9LAMI|nr:hypothetical protein F511_19743 [Dorcoceras hygrometricum]